MIRKTDHCLTLEGSNLTHLSSLCPPYDNIYLIYVTIPTEKKKIKPVCKFYFKSYNEDAIFLEPIGCNLFEETNTVSKFC